MAGITAGRFSLRAFSIAGIATTIVIKSAKGIPKLNVAFDIGTIFGGVQDAQHVFLSHAHTDHVGAIAAHARARSLGTQPPVYYVPKGLSPLIRASFHAFERMDVGADLEGNFMSCECDCEENTQENPASHTAQTSDAQASPCCEGKRPDILPFPATITEVSPGESIDLGSYVVKVLATKHRVPSQGYLIYSRHKVPLSEELKSLPRQELKAMKDRGELPLDILVPEICYAGDTLIEGVLQHEDALKAKILIMEATFLDSTMDVAKSRKKGHIHLDEIVENADKFMNERIIFCHMSARYGFYDIIKHFRDRLPSHLKQRCSLALEGQGVMSPDVLWEKANAGPMYLKDAKSRRVVRFTTAFSKSDSPEHHFAVAEEIRKSLIAKQESECVGVYHRVASPSACKQDEEGEAAREHVQMQGEELFSLLFVSWDSSVSPCSALLQQYGAEVVEIGHNYARCVVTKSDLKKLRVEPKLEKKPQRREFKV